MRTSRRVSKPWVSHMGNQMLYLYLLLKENLPEPIRQISFSSSGRVTRLRSKKANKDIAAVGQKPLTVSSITFYFFTSNALFDHTAASQIT